MSQTLTKPVLLDETGQAIAGKLDTNSAAIIEALDDIKDAIGTSSEFIPVKIQVVTPPTKTIYKVGERLDLSGIVVNLVGTNGVQIDVTSACTFSPANNTVLTASDTTVTVTYLYQHDGTTFTTSQALVIRELSSIAVTTPPTKTAYQTGETLDLTGIVVTATYSDGFTANVTSDCTFNPANGTVLSSSDTSVTITYVEGSITKTTSVAIGVKELVSIAVTHLPTKTSYMDGETLDLTGLVVTATYDDTTTLDVTAHCAFSPADGDTLTTSDTTILISYTEGTVTKTTSQAITVIGLSSIAITQAPTTTSYKIGDTLDLTGIEVTATYSDNTTEDVTSQCTFSPANGATLTSSNASVTASFTFGSTTKTATQAITVEPHKYGVSRVLSSDPAKTRLYDAQNLTFSASVGSTAGSSDFDNCYPWSDIERVTINGDVFVKIPKFWIPDISYVSWDNVYIIADGPSEGFRVHPAFIKGGVEYDYILVAAYECGPNYVSKSGQTPLINTTLSDARTGVTGKGSGYHIMDLYTWSAIQALILVETANFNSQAVIGSGYSDKGGVQATGGSDNVPNLTGAPSGAFGQVPVVWRGIENLWGNTTQCFDGTLGADNDTSRSNLFICNDPTKYADTVTSDYIQVQPNDSNTWIKTDGAFISGMNKMSNAPELFLPNGSSTTASGTTYGCDTSYKLYSNNALASSEQSKLGSGLFGYRRTGPTSISGFGYRMIKLPTT